MDLFDGPAARVQNSASQGISGSAASPHGGLVSTSAVLSAAMSRSISRQSPTRKAECSAGCQSASNFDPSPFMVQVFGTVSEFAVFVESNRRPRVTPRFSSKQVAGQGLALMPFGVTVRRRFTRWNCLSCLVRPHFGCSERVSASSPTGMMVLVLGRTWMSA